MCSTFLKKVKKIDLTYYNSRRESHYLTRSAVVRPYDSPWTKLLHDGDDSSFLNLSGMTKCALAGTLTSCLIKGHVGFN